MAMKHEANNRSNKQQTTTPRCASFASTLTRRATLYTPISLDSSLLMLSMLLSIKPNARSKPTTTTTTMMTRDLSTPTAPSTRLQASPSFAADAGDASGLSGGTNSFPEDPFLYPLPPNVHAAYRPLPLWLNISLWLVSLLISVVGGTSISWSSSSKKITFSGMRQLFLRGILPALLFKLTVSKGLQDFLPNCRPSRLTMKELLQSTTSTLPSKLSKYKKIALVGNNGASDDDKDQVIRQWAVHYLAYVYSRDQGVAREGSRQKLLYVNHGFGGSSLMWLPSLPHLTRRLGCRVGLGHDAPGFGFTSREFITVDSSASTTSARLGASLVQDYIGDAASDPPSLILMGHSMGCLTTLQQALDESFNDDDNDSGSNVPMHIILCAPVLGIQPPAIARKRPRLFPRRIGRALAAWILRRVVGKPGFWKRGLAAAWGDPSKLTDADILRFSWPSVIKGWEKGLVDFAAIQASSTVNSTDVFGNVLKRSNTRVDIIVGSKDKIAPVAQIRRFLAPFDSDKIRITEMDGLGHDPFEEDVISFVDTVERLVNS